MNRWLAATLLAVTASMAVPARADGPYEGQWREGPMNIRVTIQSWGGDCGPRPQSTTTRGGGTFEIAQSGDHLTFRLRRQRSTRTCWSENRAVRRVSSSTRSGTWTIVCRTPPSDSRAETGRYTIQAIGPDRLQFTDRSEYDWQLNESRCQARIRTTQTFTRVSGGSSNAEPTTPPPRERCTPGAPARIALRPARADVQPGGEQCFTVRVVDASGCPVRGRRPELRLGQGSGGSVSGLCYRAGDTSGTGRVVATQGSLRAEAHITVRTMDLSDLIARRTETGSVGSGAPEQDATSRTAARVSAREADEDPGLLAPSIAVGGALLLVLFGAIALRMRSKATPVLVRGGPVVREPVGVRDPGAGSPPEPEPPREPEPPVEAGEDLICPRCRRGYPPGTESCADDGAALMPYREFASAGQDEPSVCPTCGKRFPAGVKFCGEDGATLVPAEG